MSCETDTICLNKVGLFFQTFNLQAHSFYESLQRSKISVEDLKENTEVCAGNEKGVLFVDRQRAYPNKQ